MMNSFSEENFFLYDFIDEFVYMEDVFSKIKVVAIHLFHEMAEEMKMFFRNLFVKN